MTETKRYDMRGMNINERIALVGKELDAICEDGDERFRIDVQDAGFPAEDAEECLDSQRAEKTDWRKKVLADMRRFLEDGAPR